MRVAVIGAGAMGSIFGAALARAGDEVAFVDSRAELVEAINRDGLTVEGALGAFHLHPHATRDASTLAPIDCAVIQVDANATASAAKSAAACLGESGFAITLQNGIGNVEALGAVLGEQRVAAGSTYNSGAALGLARVLHSNAGPTVVGEVAGRPTARIEALAARLRPAHRNLGQCDGRGVEQIRPQLRDQSGERADRAQAG